MSDWTLEIPHHGNRDEVVLDVVYAAREKFGKDDQRTQVAEAIASDAFHNRSIITVGELLDELDGLNRAGLRARLDWARAEVGLPTTREVEKSKEDFHFEAAFNRLQPPDPPKWSSLQRCPECGVYPTKDGRAAGVWVEVDCEQWWCSEHRAGHEADMQRHEEPYTGKFTRGGRPIPTEKEKARLEAWHRERQEKEDREREQREQHQEAEAEAIEEAKERFRNEATISIMGIRCRPDGRIIQ